MHCIVGSSIPTVHSETGCVLHMQAHNRIESSHAMNRVLLQCMSSIVACQSKNRAATDGNRWTGHKPEAWDTGTPGGPWDWHTSSC